MPEPAGRSLARRLFGSITFQLLLFVGIFVLYNRVVFATASVSSRPDFSCWAAPLYAMEQTIPVISRGVVLRWSIPLVIAGAWIGISLWWMRADQLAGSALAHWEGEAPAEPRLPTFPARREPRPSINPSLITRLRVALGVVVAFNLTTAMMDDGIRSITWPFSMSGEEYFGDAAKIVDPIAFLRDYPTLELSRHASTHPPGGVMFLWAVRKCFGDGLMPASLAAIITTALTLIPAALLASRLLSPRAAAIFVALYPLVPNLVIFGATSMDGVFMFFLVLTAHLFFRAALDTTQLILRSIHVGFWLAVSAFFTYATIGLVVLFVAWWLMRGIMNRRAIIMLFVMAVTLIACFLLLYALTGCNIVACVRKSITFDAQLMREIRGHYWDVSFTNLLGFLVGSGFITTTLWMRAVKHDVARYLRPAHDPTRPPARLSMTLAVTIMILSFSLLFTREVERIWMYFTPLLLIGAAEALDRIAAPHIRVRWIAATMVLLLAQTWLTQVLLYTLW